MSWVTFKKSQFKPMQKKKHYIITICRKQGVTEDASNNLTNGSPRITKAGRNIRGDKSRVTRDMTSPAASQRHLSKFEKRPPKMPHPTTLFALSLMQCQRRLQISRVKNIGNIIELRGMAFCLVPPYGKFYNEVNVISIKMCVLASHTGSDFRPLVDCFVKDTLLFVKFADSTLNNGRTIWLFARAHPFLRTFVQRLITFCSRMEAASDIISSRFVRTIFTDKWVKVSDPHSNPSWQIPP